MCAPGGLVTEASGVGFDADTQAQIDVVIDHINDHHGDTVLFVARHLDPRTCDAELSAIEPTGAMFAVRDAAGVSSNLRLDFPVPATDANQVQGHLLGVVTAARAAAGPDEPLTSLEAEYAAGAQLATTHGRVAAVRTLTPNLLEVTLAGFVDYPLTGGDEFVYAMVSHAPDGIAPDHTMERYLEQPEGGPVRGAYYTVRRSRPDVGEIDLWVVVHDHPGSVAAWMAAAEPGAPIALWGPRRGFELPQPAGAVLLVADETGFAAVAALIDAADPDHLIHAILEVVDGSHRPELPGHPGLTVDWVHRGDDLPGTVNRLLDTVVERVHDAPDAAFGAAESRQISAVRRHVRSTLGMSAADVLMTGYWRAVG